MKKNMKRKSHKIEKRPLRQAPLPTHVMHTMSEQEPPCLSDGGAGLNIQRHPLRVLCRKRSGPVPRSL